jgi:hypothetical protein
MPRFVLDLGSVSDSYTRNYSALLLFGRRPRSFQSFLQQTLTRRRTMRSVNARIKIETEQRLIEERGS